ncbi:MAG: hypothetical protein HOW59_09000, partial [Nonomuraea sp.]|nr:hypothetical protein [Nonomuraea sp.]
MADLPVSRRSVLRSAAFAGALAVLPGLLSACGSSEPGKASAKDVLRVALPSSIASLDAAKEAGIMNYVVALLVQESLVGVGQDGSLQP